VDQLTYLLLGSQGGAGWTQECWAWVWRTFLTTRALNRDNFQVVFLLSKRPLLGSRGKRPTIRTTS